MFLNPKKEFEKFWIFMKQEYGIIFDHPQATLEWVNKYTLILKLEGSVLTSFIHG